MKSAYDVIRLLDLKPLPEEGGYFRETYRDSAAVLPAKYFEINAETNRTISTGIFYLVIPESFSALHRVKSDEVFHFYSGDPVEMIQIDQSGQLKKIVLGSDIFSGHTPQVVVPRGVWQGLKLSSSGRWALMGTTVAPGFEFEDFEVGKRDRLIQQFPNHRAEILKFTRAPNENAH